MTDHDPHLWPEPTRESLLAGLRNTTAKDDAKALADALEKHADPFTNHVHVALDGARMAPTMAQMRWAPGEVA